MTADGRPTGIVLVHMLVAYTFAHVHTGFASRYNNVVGRAVAPEASIQVGAGAWTTGVGVHLTLIHIDAGTARVIKSVSLRADAQETTKRIRTAAIPAGIGQLGTLVHIFKFNSDDVWSKSRATGTQFLVVGGVFSRADVAAPAPGSSHGTAAGSSGHGQVHRRQTNAPTMEVAPGILVAQVLPGINTACPTWCQAVVWRALAHIGAEIVDAGTMLARLRTAALVNVCAVASSFVQLISGVTVATEHAENVFALAVHADVREHTALVDIHTAPHVIRLGKSHVTFAPIGASIIDALAILTDGCRLQTFVNVLALKSISNESLVTDTLEGTIGIDACCVRVTASIVPQALINVFAVDTITIKTLFAGTTVGSVEVGTVRKFMAVIVPICALIIVSAVGLTLLDRVARLTTTDVGTQRILATSMSA